MDRIDAETFQYWKSLEDKKHYPQLTSNRVQIVAIKENGSFMFAGHNDQSIDVPEGPKSPNVDEIKRSPNLSHLQWKTSNLSLISKTSPPKDLAINSFVKYQDKIWKVIGKPDSLNYEILRVQTGEKNLVKDYDLEPWTNKALDSGFQVGGTAIHPSPEIGEREILAINENGYILLDYPTIDHSADYLIDVSNQKKLKLCHASYCGNLKVGKKAMTEFDKDSYVQDKNNNVYRVLGKTDNTYVVYNAASDSAITIAASELSSFPFDGDTFLKKWLNSGLKVGDWISGTYSDGSLVLPGLSQNIKLKILAVDRVGLVIVDYPYSDHSHDKLLDKLEGSSLVHTMNVALKYDKIVKCDPPQIVVDSYVEYDSKIFKVKEMTPDGYCTIYNCDGTCILKNADLLKPFSNIAIDNNYKVGDWVEITSGEKVQIIAIAKNGDLLLDRVYSNHSEDLDLIDCADKNKLRDCLRYYTDTTLPKKCDPPMKKEPKFKIGDYVNYGIDVYKIKDIKDNYTLVTKTSCGSSASDIKEIVLSGIPEDKLSKHENPFQKAGFNIGDKVIFNGKEREIVSYHARRSAKCLCLSPMQNETPSNSIDVSDLVEYGNHTRYATTVAVSDIKDLIKAPLFKIGDYVKYNNEVYVVKDNTKNLTLYRRGEQEKTLTDVKETDVTIIKNPFAEAGFKVGDLVDLNNQIRQIVSLHADCYGVYTAALGLTEQEKASATGFPTNLSNTVEANGERYFSAVSGTAVNSLKKPSKFKVGDYVYCKIASSRWKYFRVDSIQDGKLKLSKQQFNGEPMFLTVDEGQCEPYDNPFIKAGFKVGDEIYWKEQKGKIVSTTHDAIVIEMPNATERFFYGDSIEALSDYLKKDTGKVLHYSELPNVSKTPPLKIGDYVSSKSLSISGVIKEIDNGKCKVSYIDSTEKIAELTVEDLKVIDHSFKKEGFKLGDWVQFNGVKSQIMAFDKIGIYITDATSTSSVSLSSGVVECLPDYIDSTKWKAVNVNNITEVTKTTPPEFVKDEIISFENNYYKIKEVKDGNIITHTDKVISQSQLPYCKKISIHKVGDWFEKLDGFYNSLPKKVQLKRIVHQSSYIYYLFSDNSSAITFDGKDCFGDLNIKIIDTLPDIQGDKRALYVDKKNFDSKFTKIDPPTPREKFDVLNLKPGDWFEINESQVFDIKHCFGHNVVSKLQYLGTYNGKVCIHALRGKADSSLEQDNCTLEDAKLEGATKIAAPFPKYAKDCLVKYEGYVYRVIDSTDTLYKLEDCLNPSNPIVVKEDMIAAYDSPILNCGFSPGDWVEYKEKKYQVVYFNSKTISLGVPIKMGSLGKYSSTWKAMENANHSITWNVSDDNLSHLKPTSPPLDIAIGDIIFHKNKWIKIDEKNISTIDKYSASLVKALTPNSWIKVNKENWTGPPYCKIQDVIISEDGKLLFGMDLPKSYLPKDCLTKNNLSYLEFSEWEKADPAQIYINIYNFRHVKPGDYISIDNDEVFSVYIPYIGTKLPKYKVLDVNLKHGEITLQTQHSDGWKTRENFACPNFIFSAADFHRCTLHPSKPIEWKKEGEEALYRIGARKLSRASRDMLVGMFKQQNLSPKTIKGLGELLDTEHGQAFISMLLGMSLNQIDEARVQKLAEQFRIESIATSLDAVIDSILASRKPNSNIESSSQDEQDAGNENLIQEIIEEKVELYV